MSSVLQLGKLRLEKAMDLPKITHLSVATELGLELVSCEPRFI